MQEAVVPCLCVCGQCGCVGNIPMVGGSGSLGWGVSPHVRHTVAGRGSVCVSGVGVSPHVRHIVAGGGSVCVCVCQLHVAECA